MPNATRTFCDYPGCVSGQPDANDTPTTSVTPPGLPTREEVAEDLRQHVVMAHILQIRLAEANAKQMEMEAKKLKMESQKIEAETARRLAEREPQQLPPQNEQQQLPPRGFLDKRDSIPRPKIELHLSESD